MRKNKGSFKAAPYLYSLPALIVIGAIVLFPILYTGYISLTNMNVYHWFNFEIIGLQNYQKAIFVLNSGFMQSMIRTIIWTILNMVIQLVFAFFVAVLLNVEGLKYRNVYKTILMFPWAMPGYVSILLWKMGIFNTEFGLLNQFVSSLGYDKIGWLSDNVIAFSCCMAVNLWLAFPFMLMIMDGALQSIDKTYYESAIIDGASHLKRLQKITLPLIKPVIAPAVIITTFTTFKQFDIIYLLTQQQGGKTGANIHTVISYVYEKAFVTNNYGYSSAVSILIFGILLVFTLVFRQSFKSKSI